MGVEDIIIKDGEVFVFMAYLPKALITMINMDMNLMMKFLIIGLISLINAQSLMTFLKTNFLLKNILE